MYHSDEPWRMMQINRGGLMVHIARIGGTLGRDGFVITRHYTRSCTPNTSGFRPSLTQTGLSYQNDLGSIIMTKQFVSITAAAMLAALAGTASADRAVRAQDAI